MLNRHGSPKGDPETRGSAAWSDAGLARMETTQYVIL